MKRILTIAAVIAVIAIIVLMLAKNKRTLDAKKVVTDRSQVPVAVSLQPVQMLDMSGTITIPATLSARDEAGVYAATSGRIESLAIEIGTPVKKGQVIGRLDVKEQELKLQAAELDVEKLNRDYERSKVLVAGNATNANAATDARYELDSKKLDAAQLRKQIADANIIAPLNGIITEKKMLAGEYAGAGAVIATLVDVYTLKAKVYVAENKVFRLRIGQQAAIIAEVLPGETFTGTVTYISPKGDENHNYLVELLVQQNSAAHLKAGLYVLATFNIGDYKGLLIPKTALADGMKDPYVYVAANGKAEERKIVLGREQGENIEVLSGLREGEQVVVNGQINIVNGSRIKAIANK